MKRDKNHTTSSPNDLVIWWNDTFTKKKLVACKIDKIGNDIIMHFSS